MEAVVASVVVAAILGALLVILGGPLWVPIRRDGGEGPMSAELVAQIAELRLLLAQATPPGEWRAVEGDLEGGTLNDYIATLLTNRQNDGTTTGRLFLTLAPNDVDPERGEEVVPAMTGDGPRAEANARLIAAAINALPALLHAAEAGIQ